MPRAGESMDHIAFCHAGVDAVRNLSLEHEETQTLIAHVYALDQMYPELFHVTEKNDVRRMNRL